MDALQAAPAMTRILVAAPPPPPPPPPPPTLQGNSFRATAQRHGGAGGAGRGVPAVRVALSTGKGPPRCLFVKVPRALS